MPIFPISARKSYWSRPSSGRKKAHKHKLCLLWCNVQMAFRGQDGWDCPRVNRGSKSLMCHDNSKHRKPLNFSLWLTGGLSQGCQKVYVFKSLCEDFLALSSEGQATHQQKEHSQIRDSSVQKMLRELFLAVFCFFERKKKCQVTLLLVRVTNLSGTNFEPRAVQIFAEIIPLILADFSPFPWKRSIWETQIFAENHRFSQELSCRKPQIGVLSTTIRFVRLKRGPAKTGGTITQPLIPGNRFSQTVLLFHERPEYGWRTQMDQNGPLPGQNGPKWTKWSILRLANLLKSVRNFWKEKWSLGPFVHILVQYIVSDSTAATPYYLGGCFFGGWVSPFMK